MSDSDVFPTYIKKNQGEQSRSTEVSLITLERAQKLDLLIHLISNLRQSLVVCGPSGIGKTTLLNELKSRKADCWPMLVISADTGLSFEGIEEQLLGFLRQNYTEYKSQSLSSILALLAEKGQKFIVSIEDAGLLVPGLVTSLIQYAGISESLKIIFVLTNDELHIKSTSDKVIDDCHFIEMPPLTEIQCGLFLKNMSSQPKAAVSFNAISDKMVAQLYRRTHGIPGKIMMELPKLSNYSRATGSKWRRVVALALFFSIAAGYFALNNEDELPQQELDLLTKPLALNFKESKAIVHPVIDLPKQELVDTHLENQFDTGNNVDSTDESVVLRSEKMNLNVIIEQKKVALQPVADISSHELISDKADDERVPEIKNKPVVIKKPINIEQVNNEVDLLAVRDDIPIDKKPVVDIIEKSKIDDRQWLLAQAEKSYTIQLIVLSQQQAVKLFLKRNPKLKEGLKYFKVSKQGKMQYVLIYGVYKNAKLATKRMRSLPVKYRNSWVRRFKELHKDIK